MLLHSEGNIGWTQTQGGHALLAFRMSEHRGDRHEHRLPLLPAVTAATHPPHSPQQGNLAAAAIKDRNKGTGFRERPQAMLTYSTLSIGRKGSRDVHLQEALTLSHLPPVTHTKHAGRHGFQGDREPPFLDNGSQCVCGGH